MDAQEELAFLRSVAASQLQTIKTLTLGCEKYGLTETTPIVRHLAAQDDEIERLRAELAEIAAALSDDRYVGSKDWRDSNVLGRIECLHVMYASASAEAELWLAHLTDAGGQINRLRAELTEARRDCRLCAQFYEGRCLLQARNVPVVCINGDAFVKVLPIRLYAIDAAMAGGAK